MKTIYGAAPVFIQSAIKDAMARLGQTAAMNLSARDGNYDDYDRIAEALRWMRTPMPEESCQD